MIGKQRSPASVRTATTASLSVVVVLSGSSAAGQAAALALKGAPHDFLAQLIFVSPEVDASLESAIERNGGEWVVAPAGSSRAEMCDLGMSHAHGSIVAVRDDIAVGNAQWLEAYRAVLPRREEAKSAPAAEAVVMDTTLLANRGQLADSVPSPAAGDLRPRVASSEMAAAV